MKNYIVPTTETQPINLVSMLCVSEEPRVGGSFLQGGIKYLEASGAV